MLFLFILFLVQHSHQKFFTAHICSLQLILLCCTLLHYSPSNVTLSLNYIFALIGYLYSFLLVLLCTQHITDSNFSLFLSLLHMLRPTRRQGMLELPPTYSIGTQLIINELVALREIVVTISHVAAHERQWLINLSPHLFHRHIACRDNFFLFFSFTCCGPHVQIMLE